MALRTFEDLEVWKRGCRLAVDVCTKVYHWKNYGLKDQLQKSSISIPSNIAEGAEREGASPAAPAAVTKPAVPAPITTRLYRSAGSGFTQSGG